MTKGRLSGTINSPKVRLSGTITSPKTITATIGSSNIGGTSNYEDLVNKPTIESVELVGNKTFIDLGLDSIDVKDINNLL